MGDLEEERRELRARSQRHRGGHDEAERKHDDAQADQDAAELALTRVRLAHEEEAGADENQERRQERKVEGEHAGHQGRTEVGAENRREGHVGGEKAFGLNARHDERGGGGALEKRCERGARRHGDGPVLEPDGEEVLEGHTEGAEHPGLDHVGSPEQEGDASGHVDERLHKSLPPWKNVLKIGGCLSILAEGPFKVLFLRENAL